MRPIYRRRRDALLAGLAEHVPDLRPVGIAAGMHLVAWLPDDLGEDALVEAALRHGVGVYPVRPYRLSPGGPGGLIFGYATLDAPAIERGIGRLSDAIAALRASGREAGDEAHIV
jgi:GntR family transcriptional regulator/MocR family aminotransferase